MTDITTDPNDPRLTHGNDDVPVPQAEAYLVLSEEEREKGFVRRYRDTYVHVGNKPKRPLRELTEEERTRYGSFHYVAFESYSESESPVTGRFWTQADLDHKACGI